MTISKTKLYPNPTSDYIQISSLSVSKAFTIYDILGAQIKKGVISINEKIDVKNFSKGLYFLKLDNGTAIKFIKK